MELNRCPLNEIKEKVIKVLNKARCLEGRTVGNTELASRILDIPEVKQAIDRMKPHKVIIYDDIRDYGGCATCGNIVNTDYFFCPECGQALDWSEDESDT